MPLDASQRAVLDLPEDASAIVLGVAGSGKTTTLVELVAERLGSSPRPDGLRASSLQPAELLVVAGSRQAATALRDRLAARTGLVTPGPMARSMPSFAHAVLTAAALADGRPAPQLLSGAEQDRIIAAMLAGHADDAAAGLPSGPQWPEHLGPQVREQAGFRAELRELMAAAAERGMTADALAREGRDRDVPEWAAAGAFMDEFERLQRLERRGADAVTAASLLRAAAAQVASTAVAVPSLVLVDDAQELTEGAVVLLEALRARGASVIAFGDPDTTTGGFRGADPALLARLPIRLGFSHLDGRRLLLRHDHRHGEHVRAFAASLAERIGAAGASDHRAAAAAGGADEPVALRVAASVDEQARQIARVVHERRRAGVAHDEIGIIVRTGRIASELASMLAALDVPVASGAPTRLREAPVVDALVQVLALATGRMPLTGELAEQLLRSDLLGLDALAVRRLKRALRHEIIAAGDEVHVPGAELVRAALEHPEALEGLRGARAGAIAARRLARMLADARALVEAESPASVDQALWAVWAAAGVAKPWQRAALEGGGVERALANRRLDAVVALFDQVARLIERRPDLDTGGFVDSWLASNVDDDSLAARTDGARVSIGTPGQFVGRELDTVVVASLQEGVWPNLRLRGSLLGANRLDGDVTDDARAAVLHDELRTFAKAVSTARTTVVLAAVESDEEQPSPFTMGASKALPHAEAWYSLRSLVAHLRTRVTAREDAAAAAALRRLADEGAAGAATAEWAGLAPITTEARLDANEPVAASPSSLQKLDECEVAWVIDRLAGSTSNRAAGFGTIVHEAVESSDATDAAALEAAIGARVGELVHESTWEAARQRADIPPIAAQIADYFLALKGEGWRVEPAEHEARFEVRFDDGSQLRGSIDWLEHGADGTVRVVDLKTGSHKPDAHPELGNLQLRAYQLAVSLGAIERVPAHSPTEARLFLPRIAPRTKVVEASAFDDVREHFVEHLRAAIDTMGGVAFSASPAEHCYDDFSYGQCAIHVLPEVTE